MQHGTDSLDWEIDGLDGGEVGNKLKSEDEDEKAQVCRTTFCSFMPDVRVCSSSAVSKSSLANWQVLSRRNKPRTSYKYILLRIHTPNTTGSCYLFAILVAVTSTRTLSELRDTRAANRAGPPASPQNDLGPS